VAAFGVVAALIMMDGSSPGVSPLVNLAVESHERFIRQPASLEITSNDGAAVSSWLTQRLHFDVGIPGGGSDDIQLLGGRVVTDEQTRAAYVAYRAGDETVSLLMTPPQEIRFTGGEVISFRNILFHPADVAGYHTLEWSDSRHTYVLVSSSPRAVYQACVICHRSETGRQLLSGFTNGI
jgi:anti-sigma factor RsiW